MVYPGRHREWASMGRLAVLVLVAACGLPPLAREPGSGPLAGTTSVHNQVRQNLNHGVAPVRGAAVQPVPCPPLSNLIWDSTIAATAQRWANRCTCGHQGQDTYGENLAWGDGLTGASAANLWAAEVKLPYDYANNQCPIGTPSFPNCGHYTALAWSTTVRIGCGFKTCKAGSGCGATDYVVCRYSPPGNISNNSAEAGGVRRPYCTATQTVGCQSSGACGGGD